ncbi:MAG: hypothetical protein AUJ89_03660, partial [Candidatus Omnitrophica bacterium CG1_02_43_210]
IDSGRAAAAGETSGAANGNSVEIDLAKLLFRDADLAVKYSKKIWVAAPPEGNGNLLGYKESRKVVRDLSEYRLWLMHDSNNSILSEMTVVKSETGPDYRMCFGDLFMFIDDGLVNIRVNGTSEFIVTKKNEDRFFDAYASLFIIKITGEPEAEKTERPRPIRSLKAKKLSDIKALSTLGQRVSALMRLKNIGVRQFARMLGVSPTAVGALRTNSSKTHEKETIKRLARMLEVDEDILWGDPELTMEQIAGLPTKGGRIRALRELKHFTADEVSNEIKVSTVTISKWENGVVSHIRPDNVIDLAELFGVTEQFIVLGNPPDLTGEQQRMLKQLETIGERISVLMEIRGLNIAELKWFCNVKGTRTVTNWLNNLDVPRSGNIVKLAEIFNVPQSVLTGEKAITSMAGAVHIFSETVSNAAGSESEDLQEFISMFSGYGINQNYVVIPRETFVEARISDKGPGIPNYSLDKIFQRGFSAMQNLSLDFAIVRDEVKKRKGIIEVVSKTEGNKPYLLYETTSNFHVEEFSGDIIDSNHGTVFVIRLPRKARARLWTKESIVDWLKNPPLVMQNGRNRSNSMDWRNAGYKAFVAATTRLFKKWRAALLSAGINPINSHGQPIQNTNRPPKVNIDPEGADSSYSPQYVLELVGQYDDIAEALSPEFRFELQEAASAAIDPGQKSQEEEAADKVKRAAAIEALQDLIKQVSDKAVRGNMASVELIDHIQSINILKQRCFDLGVNRRHSIIIDADTIIRIIEGEISQRPTSNAPAIGANGPEYVVIETNKGEDVKTAL